ncbi:ABC-F family ATP-binding cassette domain-containing protein [Paenibacillus yanchengensis]|uniref:ABC-F family ATP-binding cassette domain-containing protein n=1 Tax=Paenibacillus yanchengensis TaxID=2035833 RepID=A0ABW4YGM4_9BACL
MLLQVSNISKSFGVNQILNNISFQIQTRDRIGLVGINGAGKSTLMKIIAGEMNADSGDIHKAKDTVLGYLAQNSGLSSERTMKDELRSVFQSLLDVEVELRELEVQIADPQLHADEKKYEDVLDRYARRSDWFREQGGFEINTKIHSVLHGMGFAEIADHTIISTLSGGQKTRLALAKLLLQQPDLLMLDEPTNYLDIETLTWLENYLRSYPGAILIVSHDRYFLDTLTQTIIEIERHIAKRYAGNYSRYRELKAAEYASDMKRFDKQQTEIARMEQFVQRNLVRATTTKRAQSRRKALDKMEKLDRPQGELKKAHFTFEMERFSGKDVLFVDSLSFTYPDQPTPVFEKVSFDLKRGETVALIGPNGTGKSTLLKTITGSLQAQSGQVRFGSNVKVGYYDQEQHQLNPQNTVLEELWNEYPHVEEARIRTILGNFLFSGEDVLKHISTLSGGERARVALAKLMLVQANLLILDEPTNHLDLFSKEVLEAALLDYEGTLLFISHDRYFLNKMAERIVELHAHGVDHFLGNYDEMLEKKRELEEIEMELALQTDKSAKKQATNSNPSTTAQSANKSLNQFEADKQLKREQRNRQRKLEQAEAAIAELEQTIAELELELTNPDIFQDYVKIQQLQQQIDDNQLQLTTVMEEWEQLLEEE